MTPTSIMVYLSDVLHCKQISEVPVQETCSPEQMAQQIGFPADTINKAAKNCGMSYIV